MKETEGRPFCPIQAGCPFFQGSATDEEMRLSAHNRLHTWRSVRMRALGHNSSRSPNGCRGESCRRELASTRHPQFLGRKSAHIYPGGQKVFPFASLLKKTLLFYVPLRNVFETVSAIINTRRYL